MRAFLPFLFTTALLAVETAGDAAKLQGKWLVVEHTNDGEPYDEVATDSQWFEFKDGRVTFRMGKSTYDAKFKLPGEQAGAVNFTQSKGETTLGIYELRGDELRLCINTDSSGKSAARPAKFESPKDSDNMLILMERDDPSRPNLRSEVASGAGGMQ